MSEYQKLAARCDALSAARQAIRQGADAFVALAKEGPDRASATKVREAIADLTEQLRVIAEDGLPEYEITGVSVTINAATRK